MEEQITKIVKNGWNCSENVQLLENHLRSLTCRADDIEKQVKKEESSGKKKRKREVENWFEDVKEVENDFNALRNRVNEEGFWENIMRGEHVVKMLEWVKALLKQSEHFDGFVLDADHENMGEPRLTSKLFGKTFEDLKSIYNCLLIDNIKNIGIYGMGGVGKTTLAKHINNHLLENKHFRTCWLTVSQETNIRELQQKIARGIGLHLSDDDDDEVRANKIFMKLKQITNFVIILDDVWKSFCLELLGNPIRAGCRLILTTRYMKVCDQMFCQRKFKVKILHHNAAWELFKATLGYQTRLEAELETVAKKIVERCDGLPLGIITMAGSMRGVESVAEWRDALNKLEQLSIGHDDMEEKVFPVLQYSFFRLKDCGRNCLLFCSLYPEDCKISRHEAINGFISLDLMDRRDTRQEYYDQGHTILNELINSCLLEEAIPYVKMHDLIRDMALRLTTPRYMVKSGKGLWLVPGEREWSKDLEVVSLMNNHIIEISPYISPQCSNLSVLLLKRNGLVSIPDSFFHHFKTQLTCLDLSWNSIKKLPNCISDMVNLNALILAGCAGLESLPHLGKLKNLRELDLHNTSIVEIPGLEALTSLKYLDMVTKVNKDENHEIRQIQKGTFSRLHYLQYLRIPCAIEVGDLEGLKQLEIFEGYLPDLDTYKKLVKSHHVSLWMDCYRICISKTKISAKNSKCNSKELFFQNCDFGNGRRRVDVVWLPQDVVTVEVINCKRMGTCLENTMQFDGVKSLSRLLLTSVSEVNFLLGLSTLVDQGSSRPVLQELEILYLPDLVGLAILPRTTFSSLRKFSIIRCGKIEKLFPVRLLQNLQNLEEVDVFYCDKLKEIIAKDDDAGWPDLILSITLPKLKRLYLCFLKQLRSIYDGILFFDSVTDILISNCPELKRLPLYRSTKGELSRPRAVARILGRDEWQEDFGAPVNYQLKGNFSNLQSVVFAGIKKIEFVSIQLLKNLERLYIRYCENLEEIIAKDDDAGRSDSTSSSSVILPKLRSLYLDDLPELRSICGGTLFCDSMTKIEILDCPKLKRLPLYLPVTENGELSIPRALSKIEGSVDWWEALEWDNPRARDVLQPIVVCRLF